MSAPQLLSPPPDISRDKLTATAGFQAALGIAAQHADDVDARGRFPGEAIEALRSAGAFSWYVPRAYGGSGASIDTLADATFELSRRCASAGMIFAMHQIQVACIVRHLSNSVWFEDYLRRLVAEQRLIASATSEVGVGGNLRKSLAALQPSADSVGLVHFEKESATVSYGAQADDVLTTLRRSPNSEHGDQVLVLTELSNMQNQQISGWDTLGMRGTCSSGFRLTATCSLDQVLPVAFAVIAAETMVPLSHILWANVWLGLSTDAFDRAQNFVRAQARQNPGTTPPAALHLSEMSVRMAECRALVRAAGQEFMALSGSEGRSILSTMGYAIRINNLKIAISEAAVELCQGALMVCGFQGYKNGGPYSVGRQLRDAFSASLMIANDRLRATNAALLLLHRDAQ